jgi:hypothetical protein
MQQVVWPRCEAIRMTAPKPARVIAPKAAARREQARRRSLLRAAREKFELPPVARGHVD